MLVLPLYQRLPRGPHRLARAQVARHQQARIHGAMVEAVALGGYERTSVREVIGLAGVSRRSFYEQFPNKQACFLSTFDEIVRRSIRPVGAAYLASRGGLEERVLAASERFSASIREDRKGLGLVLVEARASGPAGTRRLREIAAGSERLLSRGFVDSPETGALPRPIVRAITGGFQGASAHILQSPESDGGAGVAEELVRWTMLFRASPGARPAERLAAGLEMRARAVSRAHGRARARLDSDPGDDRERLLRSALSLVAVHHERELEPGADRRPGQRRGGGLLRAVRRRRAVPAVRPGDRRSGAVRDRRRPAASVR